MAHANLQVKIDGEYLGEVGKGFPVSPGKKRITLLTPLNDRQGKHGNQKIVSDLVLRFKPGREYTLESIMNIPTYPHTFDAGLSQFSFMNSTIRAHAASESLLGWGFTYTYQELWRTFDLGLSFHHFPRKDEVYHLESGSAGEKNVLKQGRSMELVNLFLAGREGLEALSTQDDRILSGLNWKLGPSFLLTEIERSYYSPLALAAQEPVEQQPKKRNLVLGLFGGIGLYSEVPSVNLRSGLEVRTYLLQNPFAQGPLLTWALMPTAFVGLHW